MSPRVLLHRLLLFLVSLLVFEGLIRKWVGGGLVGNLVFFLKDAVCFVLLLLVSRAPRNRYLQGLSSSVASFAFALTPLIVVTMFHDPVLGLFGAKQYLLWAAVAMAVIAAYLPDGERSFFRLLGWMAVLTIPTTLVAVYQQRLPAGHWLNLTPDGGTMLGFSSGGYLRVTGTFVFVAQYCMFLNALCFAIPAAMSGRTKNVIWKVMTSAWLLVPFFIVGTFITGSRGAVIGNAAIIGISLLLLLSRGGGTAARFAGGLTIISAVSLWYLRDNYPEFFAAYDARSEAVGDVSHIEQMVDRISTGLFGWVGGLPPRAPASLTGYGLGVMSNGSDRISEYAASWRRDGFWTETDQSTTLFEGGFYLVVIWYGLRLLMIARVLGWAMQIRSIRFLLPATFAAGFVAVIGLIGTLSIQPPVAIWWWLAVGSVACLHAFDVRENSRKRRAAKLAGDAQVSGVKHEGRTIETAGV
jgi:hypothetical protein